MTDMQPVIRQVQRNCDISDARFAGMFSICSLALRLRDVFKWENNLPPWEEKDPSTVLEWIGEKESYWEELADLPFQDLRIAGSPYGVFDTQAVNRRLLPRGWCYGAGYARGLKPTFFLAPVEKDQRIDGHRILTVGREKARDLLTLPAFAQDDDVLVRKDAAMLYLWDQMVYIKKSGRRALRYALGSMGIPPGDTQALKPNLAAVFEIQKETFIYHELGEIQDPGFDRDQWRSIVSTYPHSAVELMARGLKDVLADTGEYGPLHHMTSNRLETHLALYLAFTDGMPKLLLPELFAAFDEFRRNRDWQTIRRAVSNGRRRARSLTRQMIRIHCEGQARRDPKWAADCIQKTILPPG